MTDTYKSRYFAEKDVQYGEKIVKVQGGYVIMSAEEYRRWRKTK